MKEEDILLGIQQNNNEAFDALRQRLFPTLNSWILKNNGFREDAEEIFQDSVMILLHLLETKRYVHQDKLNRYLFSIQKRLWLKKLRKIQYNRVIFSTELEYISDTDAENAIIEYERYQLYQKHFARLSAKCQELMELRLKKVDYEDIALIMGYRNLNVTRVKKHQCQRRLINFIRNDPEFNQ